MKFRSPFGEAELTDERLTHIIRFHPEVRQYQKTISQTLSDPELIRRSKFDEKVYILYRTITLKKYLAVVLKTNRRNFVLTTYLTDKIQHLP